MRQINLLPEDLQKAEQVKSVRNLLVTTLGPVLIIVFVIHLLLSFEVRRLQTMAAEPPAAQETPEIRQLRQEVVSLRSDVAAFVEKNQAIIETAAQRLTTPFILKVIADLSTEKVWLSGLSMSIPNRACDITGKSFNTRMVSEFMLELRKVAFFQEVELVSMEKASENEVSFKITCRLR